MASTLSAGTKTSSISTSWLAVPRMPSVSQLSRIRTPSARTGTAMLSTVGVPSSSSANIVENTFPTGTWLQNTLRPETRYPPSTGTAVPRGRVKSAPPVETRTSPSSAILRKVASAPGSPRRYRHAVNNVTCMCMADASAVEPHHRARWRCAIAVSRIVAPRPPSSSGTGRARYPDDRNRSNASVTNVPSRSCWLANGAMVAPSSSAQRTRSSSRSVTVGRASVVVIMRRFLLRSGTSHTPCRFAAESRRTPPLIRRAAFPLVCGINSVPSRL